MRVSIIFAAAIVLLSSAQAQTPPTATEQFNLRIRCKKMGEAKFEQLNSVDAGMGDKLVEMHQAHYNTKYDPKYNRCYIEIYMDYTMKRASLRRVSRQLYDAQVDELIAFTKDDNGQKVGLVFDKSHKVKNNANLGYDDTDEFMTEVMDDSRKWPRIGGAMRQALALGNIEHRVAPHSRTVPNVCGSWV